MEKDTLAKINDLLKMIYCLCTGVPAITVPASLSPSGLPIGLQFVGPNFQDRQVLTVAKWFEQQTNFKQLDLNYLIDNS